MLRYLLKTLLQMNLFAESLAAEGSNSSELLRAFNGSLGALDVRNLSAPHGSEPPEAADADADATAGPWRAPRIVEHPQDVLVARGHAATLRCRAEGRPAPRVRWYRDGAPVRVPPGALLLPGGSLLIARAQPGRRADEGLYACVATNRLGRATSRNASLEVAVLRDEFRQAPAGTAVRAGDAAVLRCVPPRGRPEPSVTWSKDGAHLDARDPRLSMRGGTLTVASARPSDAGAYVCVAANAAGRRESAPAELLVLEPPVFGRRPRGRAVLAAGTAELACEVHGEPVPAVHWRKEDGELPAGRWQQRPDNALRIARVTPADEGTYTCVAENRAGRAEASAALRVHVPPQLVTAPRDQAVARGHTATFPCEARGKPAPTVFWQKEGSQMLAFPGQPPGRVSVAASGTLSIAEVRAADGGYYTCQAVSVAGSARARALLHVEDVPGDLPPPPASVTQLPPPVPTAPSPCPASSNPFCMGTPPPSPVPAAASPVPASPPAPPSAPRVTAVTANAVTLAWESGRRDGAGPVTSYIVETFSQAWGGAWRTVATDVRVPEHTVGGLRPATVYLFLVRAANAFGLSEASGASEPVCTRRGAEEEDGDEGTMEPMTPELLAVQLQEPVVLPAGTVRLTWTVSGPAALLRGYRVLYRRRGQAAWDARDVPGGAQRGALLAGLQPAQDYELQVRAVPEGAASAVRALRTPEAAPGGPPRAVHAAPIPDGISVSWEPPPPGEHNGVIRDYWIWCLGNESRFDLNASVEGTTLTAVLRGLLPGVPYQVQVAAATAAGVGVRSPPVPVRLAPVAEGDAVAPVGRGRGSGLAARLAAVATRPAFLAGLAGAAWLLLAGSGACVYVRRQRKKEPRSFSATFPCAGGSSCRIPRPGAYPWLADMWPDAPWEPPGALGWLRAGKPGAGGDIPAPEGSLGSGAGKAVPPVQLPWPELLPPPPLPSELSPYEEEEEEEDEPTASSGPDEWWPPLPERGRESPAGSCGRRGAADTDRIPRLRELDARRVPRRPRGGTLPRASEDATESPVLPTRPKGRPGAKRGAGQARPGEAEGSRRHRGATELPPPPPLPPEDPERRAAPDESGKAALVASSRGSTGSRGRGRTPPRSPLVPFALTGDEAKAVARVTVGSGTRGDEV